MLTNELWFVIINKLSQVSDNKPLQNEAKQNKKVVDKYSRFCGGSRGEQFRARGDQAGEPSHSAYHLCAEVHQTGAPRSADQPDRRRADAALPASFQVYGRVLRHECARSELCISFVPEQLSEIGLCQRQRDGDHAACSRGALLP